MNASNEIGSETRIFSLITYILLLCPGFSLLGGVIAHVQHYILGKNQSEWVKSHFRWQVRTFWIGTWNQFFAMILSPCLFFFIPSGGVSWALNLALFLGLLAWNVMRCIKGLRRFSDQQPIQNVTTRWI